MSNILAIESAIYGGSLCLLDSEGATLAETVDDADIARAEELLFNIDWLINQSGVSLRDVRRIVVSNGPGSYTGIRVGIATGLGLARSLNADCVGVSVLEAIAASVRVAGEFIVAVPLGRHRLAWQRFMLGEVLQAASDIRLGDTKELLSLKEAAPTSIVIPPQLQGEFSEVLCGWELVITDANLARLIGKEAIVSDGHLPPRALYIRADDRVDKKT